LSLELIESSLCDIGGSEEEDQKIGKRKGLKWKRRERDFPTQSALVRDPSLSLCISEFQLDCVIVSLFSLYFDPFPYILHSVLYTLRKGKGRGPQMTLHGIFSH
jgi:hypothetical protein